ncbi:MAG: maleylpyruvate isomerase family mycothiol-dependent enzyme, partial [Actinomycetota bacterium]
MPEPLVALVNDQRSALLGLLTNLPADDWNRTTAVRGWPVHDVVAHLVEGELLFGRVYRGELNALTREDADPFAGVERWRRADGETLRFSLWHHGSAVQRVIDSRSEESWQRDVPIFDRPLRLRDLLRLHFFDLALHSHDITAALGAPSLWGDRIPHIIAFCVDGAPDALTRAGAKAEGGVLIEVAGIGSWTLEHPDGTWRVAEPREGTTLHWQTDPETLVLVTT